jgi:hypothetical protein
MKTAAEYRAMAEECFKWAREAKVEEVRKPLLELGQIWLLLLNLKTSLRHRHNQRQTLRSSRDAIAGGTRL